MYTQHYRKYMIKINHVYNEAKSYIKENILGLHSEISPSESSLFTPSIHLAT